MTNTPIIAIIGTGNMGSSLINGLIKSGHPAHKLWGTCPNKEKLEQLHHYFHIHTSTNNIKACESADVIIFAVKPQIFQAVAMELAPTIQKHRPLIISIVSGISINSILCSLGIIVWLPQEKLMDVVTALSGSGPAYFFLVMEALQQAAQQLGLPQETALLLVKETALGAARMAIESDHSLEELRQKVTSPGGTTEKAIAVLEENQIRKIFEKAIQAAVRRSEELG